MQQAILMYNTDSGEIPGTWGEPENNSEAVEEYWQKHFAPYFQNVVKLEKPEMNTQAGETDLLYILETELNWGCQKEVL